jgi:Flp pilus assembly protein TadB
MPDDFGPARDDGAEHAAAPIVPDPRASEGNGVAEKPGFLVWAGLSLAATVVLSLLFSAAGNGATVIVFLLFLVGLPVLLVKLWRKGTRVGRDEADRRHGR